MTTLVPGLAARLVDAELAANAAAIDWADLDQAAELAERLLGSIADRLAELSDGESDLADAPSAGCGLVDGGRSLWVGDQVEIAICAIAPASRARHVHRRPVTARVLRGTTRLALFGGAGPLLAEGSAGGPPPAARFLRTDGAGRTITLHADQEHLLEVDQPATLLVLRGPSRDQL